MVLFDGGLFFLMLGLGIFFMVTALKFSTVFHLLGAVIFFALAIIMLAGYDVAFITVIEDGTNQINQTNYILGDGTTTTQSNSAWIGWIFLLIGVLMSIMFFFGMMNNGGM